MAHIIITHIICDGGLPKIGNKKQVSPICSNPFAELEEGVCFLGYNGCKRLKISDVETQKGVYRLPEQPAVKEDCYILIDANGNVYYNPDYHLQPSEFEELIGVAVSCSD